MKNLITSPPHGLGLLSLTVLISLGCTAPASDPTDADGKVPPTDSMASPRDQGVDGVAPDEGPPDPPPDATPPGADLGSIPDLGVPTDTGPSDLDAGPPRPCVDPLAVLTESAWTPVFVERGCLGCHREGGTARMGCADDVDGYCAAFELKDPNTPMAGENAADVMGWNLAQIEAQAAPFDGDPEMRPYIVVKATGGAGHIAGQVLAPERGTPEEFTPYEALLALLDAIEQADPAACEEADDRPDALERLQYASPQETWRALTIQIARRLPTPAENAALAQAPDDAAAMAVLSEQLDTLLGTPEVHGWLKERWNDVFMFRGIWQETYDRTYGMFVSHDYGARLWSDMQQHRVGGEQACRVYAERFGYVPYADKTAAEMCHDWFFTHRGISQWTAYGAIESPLELIAYLIENRRPFSEIVTSQTIMMNAYTSNVFFGTADPETNLFFADPTPKPMHPRLMNGHSVRFDLETYDHRFFLPIDGMRFTRLTNEDQDPPPIGRIIEKQVQQFTRAGILTTPAFFARYPSNAINLNRHRAWQTIRLLLGHDILEAADREVDLTAVVGEPNPTVDVPACEVCHVDLDPVAALFQTFAPGDAAFQGDTPNRMRREELGLKLFWPPELHPPGTGPIGAREDYEYGSGEPIIGYLARQIVADERFARTMVAYAWRHVLGQPPPTSTGNPADPAFPIRRTVVGAQMAFFETLVDQFVDDELDLWPVYRALFTSPWFRVNGVIPDPETDGTDGYESVGRGGPITPEHLLRTVEAVWGRPWPFRGREVRPVGDDGDHIVDEGDHRNDFLLRADSARDSFDLMLGLTDEDLSGFFGGIDFFNTLNRPTAFNAIMTLVVDRISNEFACYTVPTDFYAAPADRVFFPRLERDTTPDDPEGERLFRETIVALYARILGVSTAPESEDVDDALTLWGLARDPDPMAADADNRTLDLPVHCRVPPGDGPGLTQDPTFTLRAWMAVVTYLVRQPEFITTRL